MMGVEWWVFSCRSAFQNEIVRMAVGVESTMVVAFIAVQVLNGNWFSVVQLIALWAAMVSAAVLTFRAGQTDGIQGAPK